MAQVPLTTIVPPGPAPAGTFTSNAINYAADPVARTLMLHVLSNDWASELGLIIDFEIDFSFDNGQSWEAQDIGRTSGGAINSRNGQLPTISIGIPANTSLKLRGDATLNQPANSIGLAYEVV